MSGFRRIGAIAIAAALMACAATAPARSEAGVKVVQPTGAACNRADFRLIIDVGHSAESPGATSARGVKEYVFNLSLATLINQSLVDAGFGKTVLVVAAGPSRPSLVSRIDIANRLSADLFLSIHHDSVPNKFLEKWEFEGEERGYSDRFTGHSIFVSNDNRHREASALFGKLLGGQLKARGLTYTPHYSEGFMGSRRRILVDAETGVYLYDQLLVLKNTHMPALLLEAGSIIHHDEELLMGTPEHQELIAAAVTDAVDTYCARQRTKRRPAAARRAAPSKKSAPAR